MMTASDVSAALAECASPAKAKASSWFFKTGKGQYGEGDVFIGVTVPEQRKIARRFEGLSERELLRLLRSKIHEERLTALLVLVRQYERGSADTKERIFDFYLETRKRVNNWDLVDSSAAQIVGAHLLPEKPARVRAVLTPLAKSGVLWDRRIAIIATYAFIRAGKHQVTFEIAEMLLTDEHDLMHKAVGWMLREVGKRVGADILRGFLKKHAASMPRTCLRYAIEHFEPSERKMWLTGSREPL